MTQEQEKTQNKPADSQIKTAGKMTVEEAGRRGGERTAQTRGHEFYQSIGKKGGEVVSRDKQHMASIGRKGGEAVSRDRAHMALIGQKGGEARSRHLKAQQSNKQRQAQTTGGSPVKESPTNEATQATEGGREKAG
jgi:hypothetical protein